MIKAIRTLRRLHALRSRGCWVSIYSGGDDPWTVMVGLNIQSGHRYHSIDAKGESESLLTAINRACAALEARLR